MLVLYDAFCYKSPCSITLSGRTLMRRRRQVSFGFAAVVALIHSRFPLFRKSQRKTISALVVGLLRRGRIGLAEIARGMEDNTTVRHRIKRAWRFLRNAGVSSHAATVGMAHWIFCSNATPAVIALDWTDLGDYVLLAAKVAVDRRAVPIAWVVVRKRWFEKHYKSRNDVEERVIQCLKEVMGTRPWILVADRGFARAELFAKLAEWGVRYVIRTPCNPWVKVRGFEGILGNIPREIGRTYRYGEALYHKKERVGISLEVVHKEPAPEPWYLATSFEERFRAEAIYRKRMWIEESFRDAKSRLGLDRFWAARPERVERMMILVALVMLVTTLVALEYRNRHGEEDPQLTTKRKGRSLSVYSLGRELIFLYGVPPSALRLKLRPLRKGA
jgi:hypothetical protein